MRKLVLAMLAALVLAVAPGSAATVTIQITAGGLVPKNATARVGDTVTWQNLDAVAHQIVFTQRAAVQCAQPLVIQPGQSGSCVVVRTGRLEYSDPTQRGQAFRGTIRVAAAPLGVTLKAAPGAVGYGGATTLSGVLSTQQAGERVSIVAQACGASGFSELATVTTGAGGAFSFAVRPRNNTSYQARYRNVASSAVAVKVRPRVVLRRLAPRRFSVRVLAARSFAGRFVVFQRYNGVTRRWVTVRRVGLRAGGTTTLPLNPTVVSRRTFTSRVRARLRVRAVLPPAQAALCYVAAKSATIRS